MAKRAAIYARVSTDDQRDNYSIPSQIAACLHYSEREGYLLVGNHLVDPETGFDVTSPHEVATKAYVDDYTSRELSRPALDAALEYLATTGFDILVVHAIDRLARDPYIRQTLEMEFEKHGAKVEYVLGNYDDTPEGEIRKDLDAVFAKWENARRVERCNRGKCQKAERGLFVAGRVPYGYILDKTALGGLAVDEERAQVVKRVFRMYAIEQIPIRSIGRTLTQEGVPTAMGGKKWRHSSLRRILTNTTYVGYGFFNKHKRNGRCLETKDKTEWIRFETTPIIEEWLFDETQRRLEESRRTVRQQATRFYLLGGMISCAVCGRAYLVQTDKAGKGRRINDAQCYRHRASRGHCCNHQISARILEPIVWEKVVEILMEPERMRQGYEDSLAQQGQTSKRLKAHHETLNRRAGALEEMRRNLTMAYLDPEISMTKAEYMEQKVQIDGEIARLGSEIKRIERDLANIPTPADMETLETFAAAMRGLIGHNDRIEPKQKRQILEMLHVKIKINKQAGEFSIEGWFGPPIEGISYQTSVRCGTQLPLPPAPA